jgi:hypothetical protein
VRAAARQSADQGLAGRTDRSEALLESLDRQVVHGLGERILLCPGTHQLYELVVEHCRLGAERLVGLRMCAEKSSHLRGHLIGAGGREHPECRCHRGSIGVADRRTDIRQIRCC